jgi:arsenate reductase
MPHNVLFLCTGNSARSIMAESILNALGGGRFQAFSAGSRPAGEVHSLAIEALERNGYPTWDSHSKGWQGFATARSPRIDFVITVCDTAAGESCPLFPGRPVSAHWGVPDPAAANGDEDERRRAFRDALVVLRRRIQQLTSLPLESMDRIQIAAQLRDIGEY